MNLCLLMILHGFQNLQNINTHPRTAMQRRPRNKGFQLSSTETSQREEQQKAKEHNDVKVLLPVFKCHTFTLSNHETYKLVFSVSFTHMITKLSHVRCWRKRIFCTAVICLIYVILTCLNKLLQQLKDCFSFQTLDITTSRNSSTFYGKIIMLGPVCIFISMTLSFMMSSGVYCHTQQGHGTEIDHLSIAERGGEYGVHRFSPYYGR